MADLPVHDNRDVHITNSDDTKKVTVTTDGAQERLDVDSRKTPRPGQVTAKAALDGANADLSVDGSVTPVDFDVVATTGKIFYVSRFIVTLQDTSINFAKFGGIAALSNGVDFLTKEGGVSERQLGVPVQNNAQFSHFGFDVNLQSASEDLLVANLEFNMFNSSLALVDSDSDYIRVVVNDNLTGITQFTVVAQGYEVDE